MSDAPLRALLAARGITKTFGRQRALDGVDFELRAGEVHALAGENGAGKSTLIRVLAGATAPDAGTITLDGRTIRLRGPADARAAGIAVVHQELTLVPAMSVTDNLFLGRERTRGALIDDRAQRAEAARILALLDLRIDPRAAIDSLPLGVRQLVEIARGLAAAARVFILDEPTSALDARESERLFERVLDVKRRGVGIVYITHRMDEIERLADRVTVLRDGKHAGSGEKSAMPRGEILRLMLGHAPVARAPRDDAHPAAAAAPILAIDRFTVRSRDAALPLVDSVALDVRPGEIVGLAGVQGSGTSSLLRALFGALPAARIEGDVRVFGAPYSPRDPRRALGAGIALLTNDRQGDGLLPDLDLVANATLAALDRFSPRGILANSAARTATAERCAELRVKSASLDQPVRQLSGGNQQKVWLARCLLRDPRVLLLDDPTRGVDVAAREELHDALRRFAASGRAVLFASTDLDETCALAHRIIVLHRGRVSATFAGGEFRRDAILAAAFGAEVAA